MLNFCPLFIKLSEKLSEHIIIEISFKHGGEIQVSVIVLIMTIFSLLLQIIGVEME
jgi:hypothetical protein